MKKENGVMLWSDWFNSFYDFIFSLFMILFSFGYLPMQKCRNIFLSTWSVVTSPTISDKWNIHSRKSCEMKSPERLEFKPSCTLCIASSACVSASKWRTFVTMMSLWWRVGMEETSVRSCCSSAICSLLLAEIAIWCQPSVGKEKVGREDVGNTSHLFIAKITDLFVNLGAISW